MKRVLLGWRAYVLMLDAAFEAREPCDAAMLNGQVCPAHPGNQEACGLLLEVVEDGCERCTELLVGDMPSSGWIWRSCGGHPLVYYPMRNVARQAFNFEMHHGDLATAWDRWGNRWLSEDGMTVGGVRGIFHSHPSGSAAPSAADKLVMRQIRGLWPGIPPICLILGMGSHIPDLRGYEVDERGDLIAIDLGVS